MRKFYLIEQTFLGRLAFWLIALAILIPLFVSKTFLPHHFAKAVVFNSLIEILIVLALVLFLKYRDIKIPINGLTLSVIIFWAISEISIIVSTQPYLSFWGNLIRSGGFFHFTHYVAWFFILIILVRQKQDWLKILNISVFVSGLIAILVILQHYFDFFNPFWLRSTQSNPAGTLANPNSVAGYLLFAFFPLIFFSIQSIQLWLKEKSHFKNILLYTGLLVPHIIAIILTQSRGAFLGLIIGLLAFLFLSFKENRKARLVILGIIAVFFISALFLFLNPNKSLPKIINLSFDNITIQNRLHTWQIAIKGIQEKPLLGYGPENFLIMFNKYYDPAYYGSFGEEETWWDRGHNIIFETAVTTGLLGLLAYLLIFFFILNNKCGTCEVPHNNIDTEKILIAAGSSITAYFVQNLFHFDEVVSLIMFFFYAALITNLSNGNQNINKKNRRTPYFNWGWSLLIFILPITWQYNLKPFKLNYITNKATYQIDGGFYEDVAAEYNKTIYQNTWIDREINNRFTRMMVIYFPELLKREMNQEALKLVNQTIALKKKNIEQEPANALNYLELAGIYIDKSNLIPDSLNEARKLLEQAEKLSPGRQQVLIGLAKIDILELKYDSAIQRLRGILIQNSNWAEAYWWLGITYHYKGEFNKGDKYITKAKEKRMATDSLFNLKFIAAVYKDTIQYEKLAKTYIKILEKEPKNNEIRALLAGTYRELKQFSKARETALEIIKIDPTTKQSVEEFLKTLSQ